MGKSTRRKFLKSVTISGLLIPLINHTSQGRPLNANADKCESVQPKGLNNYLEDIKIALNQEWPKNRTINLVFHGHSVPSGYFKTPIVNSINAYPHLLFLKLKEVYPNAVINCITTAIGGENAQQGAKRFHEVTRHKPDVVFIDYALNDRGNDLVATRNAWKRMIVKCLKKNIKLILLTSSPDTKEDIQSAASELSKHNSQIKDLAKEFEVGIADCYGAFKDIASSGRDLTNYMAQFNHPNEMGHQVICNELLKFF